jgi:hypothetical protein
MSEGGTTPAMVQTAYYIICATIVIGLIIYALIAVPGPSPQVKAYSNCEQQAVSQEGQAAGKIVAADVDKACGPMPTGVAAANPASLEAWRNCEDGVTTRDEGITIAHRPPADDAYLSKTCGPPPTFGRLTAR